MPGELIAAFLYAQLEEAEKIIAARLQVWDYYHQLLEPLEKSGTFFSLIIKRKLVCLVNYVPLFAYWFSL